MAKSSTISGRKRPHASSSTWVVLMRSESGGPRRGSTIACCSKVLSKKIGDKTLLWLAHRTKRSISVWSTQFISSCSFLLCCLTDHLIATSCEGCKHSRNMDCWDESAEYNVGMALPNLHGLASQILILFLHPAACPPQRPRKTFPALPSFDSEICHAPSAGVDVKSVGARLATGLQVAPV